jgi:hypothetical protein
MMAVPTTLTCPLKFMLRWQSDQRLQNFVYKSVEENTKDHNVKSNSSEVDINGENIENYEYHK